MATSRGDCGIWREATGGSSYDSASWLDYTFDTEVLAEGDFARSDATTDDFEMPSGHVLVIHNHGYEGSGGSSIAAVEIGLELDSSDILYGRAGGYIRFTSGSTHWEAHPCGAAILNVGSTGDILTSRIKRTDLLVGSTYISDLPNYSGIQCIKLDDNRGYFRATRSTSKSTAGIVNGNPLLISDLNSSANWDEVDWDSPDEEGRGFSLTGGDGTSEIVLPAGARVLVTYGVNFHMLSGSDRRNGVVRLQTRDGAGSWTTVTNSYSTGYCRTFNNVETAWASNMVLINTSGLSDPRLRVQFTEECETGSSVLEYIEAYITIGELPDAADYAIINTDSDETSFTQTATNTTFESSATELDTDSFDYLTQTTIKMKKSEKYLFFAQFCTERSADTTDWSRKEPEIRFRPSAGDYQFGRVSSYNRGDQSTLGCWIAGGGCGFLHSATANDTMVIKHLDHAKNSTLYLQAPAGYISVQAVNLDSSFFTHYEGEMTSSSTVTSALVGAIAGILTTSCSTSDSHRGGMVLSDTCSMRSVAQVDNYAPLDDMKPDTLTYMFSHTSEDSQSDNLIPMRDESIPDVDYWKSNFAGSFWQALDKDVDGAETAEFVTFLGGSYEGPYVGIELGYSSVPQTWGNADTITLRWRITADFSTNFTDPNDFVRVQVVITNNYTSEEVYNGFTSVKGQTFTNEILEVEISGLDLNILDINSLTTMFSFPGGHVGPPPDQYSTNVTIYAHDMVVSSTTKEKTIDIEAFEDKPEASSGFSSGKSISGDGWTEDVGPSGEFPPS